jgi:integrase
MAESPKNPIISSTYALEAVPVVSEAIEAVIPREQVEREVQAAAEHAKGVFRDNTRLNYGVQWQLFCGWCRDRGILPAAATPEIVATYLHWRFEQGAEPRSLGNYYSAIAAHLRETQKNGEQIWVKKRRPLPVFNVIAAAFNKSRTAIRRKHPLRLEDYMKIADPDRFKRKLAAGEDWGALARDRAVLLFGLASGMRRSELVALRLSDLEFEERGVVARIMQSKANRTAEPEYVGVVRWPDRKVCPVAAIERLVKYIEREISGSYELDAPGVRDEWFVFHPLRSHRTADGIVRHALRLRPRHHLVDDQVARIVKTAAKELGLDDRDFAGHSLRAGFVTISADRGATLEEIMYTTRHKSFEQVQQYIRRANPFERNASRLWFESRK